MIPSQLPSGIAVIIGVERVDSSSKANAEKSITDNGVAGRNILIGGLHAAQRQWGVEKKVPASSRRG